MGVWGDTDLRTYRPTCQSTNSPIDMFKSNIPLHLPREAWPSPWHLREGLGGVGEWNVNIFFLPNLTFYLIVQGFHRTYATGAACQQRTLTPPDTWSCPTLGLACVLMSRPISPELVLSPDFWISNTPRYFSFVLYFHFVIKYHPVKTRGVKSRMCPPYPRRVVKGD